MKQMLTDCFPDFAFRLEVSETDTAGCHCRNIN